MTLSSRVLCLIIAVCSLARGAVSAEAISAIEPSFGSVKFSNAIDCLQQGQQCVNLIDATVQVNYLLTLLDLTSFDAWLHPSKPDQYSDILRYKFHRLETSALLRQKVKTELKVLSSIISKASVRIIVQSGDLIAMHLLSQAEKWSDVSRRITNFAVHCFKLTELQTKLLRQIHESLDRVGVSGNVSISLQKVARYAEGVNIAAEKAMTDALYVAQQVFEASVMVREVANAVE